MATGADSVPIHLAMALPLSPSTPTTQGRFTMATTRGRGFYTNNALDVDVVRHSGALIVSALVSDGGDRFYESLTFYGYDEDEARSQYVATITERGYRIVTEWP